MRTFASQSPQQLQQRGDVWVLCYDIKTQKRDGVTEYSYLEKIFEEKPTQKQIIDVLMSAKYDHNDEFAIINDKDEKPDEYAAYQAYRKDCKQLGKSLTQ